MRQCFLYLIILILGCQSHPLDPVIALHQDYFETVATNDLKLSKPQPGDWRDTQKEKAQSFDDYKKTKAIGSTTERSTVYLQPIGNFTPLQLDALRFTGEYISIFFQRKAVLLPTISDHNFPKNVFRERGSRQLLAPYVMDSVLRNKLPKNGISLMAITEKDLYPNKDWNFVFGLASYGKSVGVSSIYRLHYGELNADNFRLCLERLINIASHEISHMLTLAHCTFAHCVMNGSNSLAETDISPNRLCSECQKKLYWNLRYEPRLRLQQLSRFFQKHGLERDFKMANRELVSLTVN